MKIIITFIILLFLPKFLNAETYYENYGKIVLKGSRFSGEPVNTSSGKDFGVLEINPKLNIEHNNIDLNLELIIKKISSKRDVFYDIKEANVNFEKSTWGFLLGSTEEFWGKTETFNPVDIINSNNYDEGLSKPNKLGEAMIKANREIGIGDLSIYYLPYFRPNKYPSKKSRLSLPIEVNDDEANYVNGADKNMQQFALRLSGYYEDLDFGISFFEGISRDPFFNLVSGKMVPSYSKISQYGIEVQQLLGEWIVKGEFINREGQQNISGSLKDYSSGVLGLEKSLYGLINGNTDFTFFLEYAKDSRGVSAHQSNQNDVFFANRITLNDIHDTSILLALSRDLNTESGIFNSTISRRIFGLFKTDLEVFIPLDLKNDTHLASSSKDKSLGMNISWFW